jgi:hypothetical protein
MKMADMELSDEEVLDTELPIAMPKKSRYPYGLRICLEEKELAKLGMKVDGFSIGDVIDLRAFAEVTCVSSGEFGARVELQIQRLAVENEATEDLGEQEAEEEGRAHRASRSPLYLRRKRA